MNLEDLRKKILYFNECYEKGSPIVSDEIYDFYKKQLKNLENKLNINEKFKISNNIGFVENKSTPHLKKILSLNHDFNSESIEKFIKLITKKIDPWPIICELKIDGVSLIARYENGNLIKISTRGDGALGEDITYLKDFLNLPDKIFIKDLIEIRFEAYLEKNIKINSRSIVAGLLMKKNYDPNLKNIKFAPHNLYSNTFKYNSYLELREIFKNLHLNLIEPFEICNSKDEIINYFNKINEIRNNLNCEIDGIVLKINDIEKCEFLGYSSTAPKFALAVKFQNAFVISKINKINFNITRNGNLMPIAEIDPVVISGKKIKNITLNNIENLIKNNFNIEDVVKIELAGEIIPKISEIIEKNNNNKIIIPEFCISCNSKLVNYKCENNWECYNQKLEKLVYFASKNCFNIKNINYSQIAFFINQKILNFPADFFRLKNKLSEIKENTTWLGEKSWNNILLNIEKSKENNNVKFYISLGMPNVAKNKAILISNKFKNKIDFLNAKLEDLNFLGEKISKDVFEFKLKENKWIKDLIDELNNNEEKINNSLFD